MGGMYHYSSATYVRCQAIERVCAMLSRDSDHIIVSVYYTYGPVWLIGLQAMNKLN